MSDYDQRFGGIRRLYGTKEMERLRRAHVCVVGIGGVGSWAVEALARSGVGKLTLIDLDEVCVSNVNRQLHALDGDIGKAKAEVMADRARAINPECVVNVVAEFLTATNAEQVLSSKFDVVLDAIDNVANKCVLISLCRTKGIPLVMTGGAGGRCDPTMIKVADLAETSHDALLQLVRKKLRDDYQFPKDGKTLFNVECVFSTEPQVYPHSDGTVCEEREHGSALRLNCDNGYGTASFVTGTFGFVAAGRVVAKIISM